MERILSGFSRLNRVVEIECPLFQADQPFAWIIVALDYYPFFLTLAVYAVSFYKNEIYLQLVSIILTFDFIVNTVMRYGIFRQEGPYPGCGDMYEMPSFAAEQGMLFSGLLYGMLVTWKYDSANRKIIMLVVGTIIPPMCKMYIGTNTPQQIAVGILFGIVGAHVWVSAIHIAMWPRFGAIFSWRVNGFVNYEDSLCGAYPRSSRMFDLRSRFKAHGIEGILSISDTCGCNIKKARCESRCVCFQCRPPDDN